MEYIKKDRYSEVWRDGSWVYKRQHEFMTDNEIYFLKKMYGVGRYVPYAEQMDRDLIRLEYIPLETVSDPLKFMSHMPKILSDLNVARIRHGDLTEHALRIMNNKPYIIDFAESRFANDPRPDKRPEGDQFWLTKTMEAIVDEQFATPV